MSTFAYEYYKRNKAYIIIGKGHGVNESQLVEIGKNKYTSVVKTTNPIFMALYESAPKFSFSQTFADEGSDLVAALTTFKNIGQAFGAAAEKIPGKTWLDKLMNLGTDAKNLDINALMEKLGGAASGNTKINVPAKTVRWGGQDPVSFKIKLIFLDEQGGPVYYETIKPLLSLAMFSGVDNNTQSWTMVGPVGFHGTTTKFAELTQFLNQSPDMGLHSLLLKKGSETVLHLKNILVVESVNIDTSEQLYLSKEKDKGPAYKWITADVGFKTACPVPGPYANTPTNVNNFYGINPPNQGTNADNDPN